MSRCKLPAAIAAGFWMLVLAAPAGAAGPVDAEVNALWWANDYSVSGSGSSDAGAPGLRAQLWFAGRYGVRAMQLTSDLDTAGTEDADYTSLDVMWKAFSPTEGNFVALGAGWQEMDVAGIDTSGIETSGVRLNVNGRVGLGPVFGYGEASYLPSLDDANASSPTEGRFVDMTAREFELGIGWKPMPLLVLRAGYRENTIDFDQVGMIGPVTSRSGDVDSSGFLAGVGIYF